MAGADYINCGECGKRLFYDGDRIASERLDNTNSTRGLTCDHCVSKLKKKIKLLEKHDRRKH